MEDGSGSFAILYFLPSILVWQNGGVRRVTLPLVTACKAGASLFSHGPEWTYALRLTIYDLAGRLGAAPSELSFGDSVAQAGARPVASRMANGQLPIANRFWAIGHRLLAIAPKALVRLPGVAPGLAPWRGAILLLNHNRTEGGMCRVASDKRPRISRAPFPATLHQSLVTERKGPGASLRSRPVPFQQRTNTSW